jgi:hypothetical protein
VQKLYVILEVDFGERLKQISPNPVWITMSPVNAPIVRSIWAANLELDWGLTGFTFKPEISPEDRFLEEIDTIDLHEGPYSSLTPYTNLEAIGVRLTDSIRNSLSEYGFFEFAESNQGFVAKRSEEAAKKLRH